MTKLNRQILEMMQNSKGHMTAEEAFLLAKRKNIDVSLASMYRILNRLTEDGLLTKVSMDGQPDVFDKTVREHGHLVCDVCGEIVDFEIGNIKEIINEEVNEDIKTIDLKLHYVCAKCRKKGV